MHQAQGSIRKAQVTDVPVLVELAEQRRLQYQEYQPRFWRKAVDSQQKQVPFFEHLLGRNDVMALVYERAGNIEGFILADLVPAPPVYDPGGPTCRVDDYCLAHGCTWESVGEPLLVAVLQEAKGRGAAQAVVVCGHMDRPKREMLAAMGFTIASEWYVKDLADDPT